MQFEFLRNLFYHGTNVRHILLMLKIVGQTAYNCDKKHKKSFYHTVYCYETPR